MTAYSEDIFNSVAGHVQQIVLAVILQQEANRDYVPDPLATDFTKNAVSWQLVTDTSNSSTEFDRYGYLQISVTFPFLNDSPLLNRGDIFQRVGTINNTDVSGLSLPRESAYLSVGAVAPDPTNPNGVPGGDYPNGVNDTLERRLAWLLTSLLAKYHYLKRWNNWAEFFEPFATGLPYSPPYYLRPANVQVVSGLSLYGLNGASRRLISMGELPYVYIPEGEDGGYPGAFQQLVTDADSLVYKYSQDADPEFQFEVLLAPSDGINSAGAEESFFDPATEAQTNIQDIFQQPSPPSQSVNAGDGVTGNETTNNSLKDC